MSETVKEKKINLAKDEILLKEYELCQKNRDHYDTIGQAMLSFFVGLALAALWLSMQLQLPYDKPLYVWLLAFFSLGISLIWVLFTLRFGFYTRTSLQRCREIEETLSGLGLELGKQLHTKIHDEDKCHFTLRGRYVPTCVFITILLAWIGRVLLAYYTLT